jgi:hypothetical protein
MGSPHFDNVRGSIRKTLDRLVCLTRIVGWDRGVVIGKYNYGNRIRRGDYRDVKNTVLHSYSWLTRHNITDR